MRALCTQSSPTPRRIVLIDARRRGTNLPALKNAGFTGYLVKPVRAASLAARLASTSDAFEQAPPSVAPASARSIGRAGKRPVDPGRRGQRDQCAAGARAAREARPSPDHRRQRRSGGRSLAGRARRRHALRSRADGRADAGHRRARSRRAASAPPKPTAATSTPHLRAHRQCLRAKIARPASPPAWTGSWSSRSIASGCARRFDRRCVGSRARLRLERALPTLS